jgi:hypothetical protein
LSLSCFIEDDIFECVVDLLCEHAFTHTHAHTHTHTHTRKKKYTLLRQCDESRWQ